MTSLEHNVSLSLDKEMNINGILSSPDETWEGLTINCQRPLVLDIGAR